LESALPGCVVPVHSMEPSVDVFPQLGTDDIKGSSSSSAGPHSAARLSAMCEDGQLVSDKSQGRLRADQAASFGAEIQRAITGKPDRTGERKRQSERKRMREAETRQRPILEIASDAVMTDAQMRTARLLAKVRKKSQD
jgi:hypothetical protein